MTIYTQVAIPTAQVPRVVGAHSVIKLDVDPTKFPNNITNGDSVKIATIPADMLVTYSVLRNTDVAMGVSTAPTAKLQIVENGVTSDLTATQSLTASAGVCQTQLPLFNKGFTKDILLNVTAGQLNQALSTGGVIYVYLEYLPMPQP